MMCFVKVVFMEMPGITLYFKAIPVNIPTTATARTLQNDVFLFGCSRIKIVNMYTCRVFCFQIFYPETTDVYDRKNMPKVVYCIHALR